MMSSAVAGIDLHQDAFTVAVVDAILASARTDKIGDGKIWITESPD